MTTSALKNRRHRDVNRTRGQLGDTAEELTHKIHVPARVRDKVNNAKQTVRVKTDEVNEQAQVNIEEANQQAQVDTEEANQQAQVNIEEANQQAQVNTEEAKPQIPEGTESPHTQPAGVGRRAEDLTPQAVEKPLPGAARIESVMTTARQRQLPSAAVAVAVLLVLLLAVRRIFCRRT